MGPPLPGPPQPLDPWPFSKFPALTGGAHGRRGPPPLPSLRPQKSRRSHPSPSSRHFHFLALASQSETPPLPLRRVLLPSLPFLTALRTRPAAGRAEFRSLAGQEAIFGAFWADPGREGTEFPRPRPPAAPLLGSPCARRAYQGESGDLSSGPASWSPWRRYAIVSSLSLLHLILPCRLPVLKIVF